MTGQDETRRPDPSSPSGEFAAVELAAPIGSRLWFEFGHPGDRGGWVERGTVAGYMENRLVITLDETIELPEHLGGGWCCEVERELAEVNDIEAPEASLSASTGPEATP